ncbi:MAG: PAS domain-containing protein [Cyanobacteria bacterium]|jgi:signal transduction histidine kinase/HAMP domain-containing protein|nr:PAS domain-containing protein [Cyanobacteria bacterium GSL.Bin21]
MKKVQTPVPKISLRWLLLIPFLIEIVSAIGLVSYFSYQSSKATVSEITHQLLHEMNEQVAQEIDHYLKIIDDINQQHLALVESGLANLDQLEQIHQYLIQEHQRFPAINSISFGNPQGDFVTSYRRSATELEAGRSTQENPSQLEFYTVQEDGRLGNHLRTIQDIQVYDRSRYHRAITTGKPAWSDPFFVERTNTLAISAYTPCYLPSGELQGVFVINLSLGNLNQLLRQKTNSATRQVMVLQRDGLSIANSAALTLPRQTQPSAPPQLSDWGNLHSLLELSPQELNAQFGTVAKMMSVQDSSLEIDGEDKYLHVAPYNNPYGLDWLIVTVVPQSEFMGAIKANRNRTIAIASITVLTVSALSIIIAQCITKALRKLSRASQVIAGGNWKESLPEDYTIMELNLLARSYNQMGAEIQHSYEHLHTALEELQATNQRLEQFLEAIPVGIGIIDAQGNPCYTNQRAMEYLGKGVVPIKSVADIPEVYQIYIAGTDQLYPYEELALIRALEGKLASNNDAEIHVRDQTQSSQGGYRVIPIETWGTPIYNQAGEIEYALVAFQDVTEQKQAERQLWDLSERLELSLAAGQIGYWEWDVSQKTIFWDQRMCNIFAVTYPLESDEIRALWHSRLHPDDRDRVYHLFHNAIAQQIPFHTEFRIIHPDQSTRFLKTYGLIRFNAQGNPQSMIGVNFDITELKETQIELEQTNAELLQANRLKDEFLATMNHELRTPLNAILGMSEALEKEMLGTLNPRQHQTLEIIQRSGSHLLDMVNDLLDLSKIESGKKQLHYTLASVVDLCQSAIAIIQPQAQKKQLELETQLPSPTLKVWVEERLLRQVLINLLNNAVKFTPQGGTITLEVRFPISQGDHWIRFAVTDTGIGIAEKNLQKIFQPFVQIDSALNRSYQGTGIGLSLVKKIVERHGGEVTVTSQEGKGSCFAIDLPCIMTNFASNLQQAGLPEKAGTAPVILVIDRDEGDLMTVSNYLEAKGYHLLVGADLEKALPLARSNCPDLVIITWEASDGLEVIRTLRREGELANTPIIAIAPQTLSDEENWEKEITHYFIKPIKLQALAKTVQATLNHL